MWVFYLISLPLTVGLVAATLRYFAGPAVPLYVLATVGYAWLCSLSFIVLVPADIWTVRSLIPLRSPDPSITILAVFPIPAVSLSVRRDPPGAHLIACSCFAPIRM